MIKISYLSILLLFLTGISGFAQVAEISSPDGKLKLNVFAENGKALYNLSFEGKIMLEKSPLGLITNESDFSENLKFVDSKKDKVSKKYTNEKIKKSQVSYTANTLTVNFTNADNFTMGIEFQVSNNNLAFRYEIQSMKDHLSAVVQSETTGYRFPAQTTTFLSPMMKPMTGFARTAPSYESGYKADAELGTKADYGYVFPGLFHVGNDGWILLSETGVNSLYCASHLDTNPEKNLYQVAYPNKAENNGFGSTGASISLPGKTPWRTITIGDSLKPIVETTIPFDVVEPMYEPSQKYTFGKSTWSWILWQDNSMNYEDQSLFINLASEMGYEYILIDALWDKNIGRERMKDLIQYARSKNVGVLLWYNSNGASNDAPMGPRNKMSSSIERKKEMKWLKEAGVQGLKVDFFGGDKQETIRLYEDILSDANDFGLKIIFHGATLPRGWEVMYPNYAGSEAVLASEMLYFSEDIRKQEAFFASLHPFIRNTVGSMEFGGTFLNKYLTKSNKDKNKRYTTDSFQLATAVLFQNPVQMFGITPNNLNDAPKFQLDFMKKIPTLWDETVFIDGYPGKYSVIARRHQNQWYVAGINAEKTVKKLKISLPMFAGKTVKFINDNAQGNSSEKEIKVSKKGDFTVEILPNGGFVLRN
ncbi:glycoside hydrolase family 97 catalytic domain-containing protein [Chryseobacterium gambrini]|uniref:Glycoside hydrolase family 97 catalytic domain-containing protein n=1 Tax=Chryseobacterium gambrini TaxID=373672 RepID=A0AAJ1VID6_9FLAO|nr:MULTISPECIES: glycoside hydrolase family 97 protein [Chryseobacterium]MDN4011028.1 glycoside hydrolase family 97 catalytic domain-containing protein [Chryseobacterium gambrini]QWA38799.1 glycoside hydrolase family 97 catalytic domain-containing protein [Chryseobacterium sp. ZHDP1]